MKLSTHILNTCILLLSASTTINAEWYFTTYDNTDCPFGEASGAYSGTGNTTCKKFPTGVRSIIIRPGSFDADTTSSLEVWTAIDCGSKNDGDDVWFGDEEDECHSAGDVSWASYKVEIVD